MQKTETRNSLRTNDAPTAMAISHFKVQGRTGLSALDIRVSSNDSSPILRESGLFSSITKTPNLTEAQLALPIPGKYDLVVVTDNALTRQMSGTQREEFVSKLLDATRPGGIVVLAYDVTYPLNGDFKAVPLEFTEKIISHIEMNGFAILNRHIDEDPKTKERFIVKGSGMIRGTAFKWRGEPNGPFSQLEEIAMRHAFVVAQRQGKEFSDEIRA